MDTHFFFRNKEASPPPARHRRTGVVLLVLAAALLTVLLTAWAMFGTQLQAAMTIQKLDDGLMERGWYRASCLSLKEVLDNRSGSSYYHGDKICSREKAPAPPDSAGPGL